MSNNQDNLNQTNDSLENNNSNQLANNHINPNNSESSLIKGLDNSNIISLQTQILELINSNNKDESIR